MKTKFTIPPHLFIHRTLAVDISIAGTRWTQLLHSISKNINVYPYNKTIPNNYCWIEPTLCLGKHECSPQGIRIPSLLFSRMNNKNRAILTSLQESKNDSCCIGSVFIETSRSKDLSTYLNCEIISHYLKKIQVSPSYRLFRKKRKNPI